MQADTLIPGAGQSQAWDRYAYAINSPVRYTDPTGHRVCEDQSGGCKAYTKASQINDLRLIIKTQFGWAVKGNDWTLKELETMYQVGNDILDYINGATGGYGLAWMRGALRNTTIIHGYFPDGHSDTVPFFNGNLGPRIRLDVNWLKHWWGPEVVLAHELGHAWDINSGFRASGEMNKDLGGSSSCFWCSPGDDVPQWQSSYHTTISGNAYGNTRRNEYFAEGFSATIYNPEDSPAGVSEWIGFQLLIDVVGGFFQRGEQ